MKTPVSLQVALGVSLYFVQLLPGAAQGPSIPPPYAIRTLAIPTANTFANVNGQVAVYYDENQPSPGAFLWDSASGTLTDLGGPAGTTPTGINDLGQVVGFFDQAMYRKVFLWTDGVMQALFLPRPVPETGYYHINNAGQIAGVGGESQNDLRAFLWYDERVKEIDVGPANNTAVSNLTSSGFVLGGYVDPNETYHPFIWRNGALTFVDVPGAISYGDIHVNDSGQVAGSYKEQLLQTGNNGFVWQDGNLTTLAIGDLSTDIGMINSGGEVVGTALGFLSKAQAFVWREGVTTVLETSPREESFGVWVNDDGLVVGRKGPIGLVPLMPCLWQNGHVLNLKDTLPAYLGWALDSVAQITNSGDILGIASREGTTYLVILHPLLDSDGDGLPDEWEVAHGLNAQFVADADVDSDDDGLTNRQEYQLGTDPMNADTDADGISDGWEVAYGGDPRNSDDGHADPDGDGLSNLLEFQLGTNPINADSDDDGLSDGQEIQLGTDPLNDDTDLDGMEDGWEVSYQLNPFTNDSELDPDNDHISNLREYQSGTNPRIADSDSDGDGWPDVADALPSDYYNTSLPTLALLSGANQAGIAGTVLPQAIIVKVTDSFGQLLKNAPLVVSASPVGASFSTSSGGPFNSQLTVRTAPNGTATVYVQLPPAVSTFAVNITAISGANSKVASASQKSVNAPAIAAGEYHTVVVGSSGTVWAWGLNSSGQLGDGTYLQRSLPSPVSGLIDVKTVSAGAYHTLALKHDGTVWSWGSNRLFQLGNGNSVDSPVPVRVGTLTNIVAISAGLNHNLALRADGAVYAWGFNGNGQLGDGTTISRNTPVLVSGTGAGGGITAICAGAYHSLALLDDGTVLGWGANFFGALGQDVGAQSLVPFALSFREVTELAAGAFHTMVVTDPGAGGEALGWNEYGELGDNTRIHRFTPVAIDNLSDLRSMAASKSLVGHCAAVSEDGTVWTWGANEYGQLGDGTTTDQSIPENIALPVPITQIAAGGSHTVALGLDGTIYSWGNNQFGELGDGTTVRRVEPVRKAGLCLLPTSLDTDQDALPDSWEIEHFGNLDQNSNSDPDDDGLKTLLEYETARNPNVKDYQASSVAPVTSQLVQMSSRAAVGTGNDAIIAGFIVLGDAPKTIIIRALGPSLASSNIPNFLANPTLEVFNQGAVIASNDNWEDDREQADVLRAYNLAPGHPTEAAVALTVPPGAYTAVISGVNNTTGIALFEVYDVDASDSNVANLSARARLGSGDNVLVAGFIVAGAANLKVLVRATGPTLSRFGLTDYLPDPLLYLNDINGHEIARNDNWRTSPEANDIWRSGLAPLDDREPALIYNLTPGANGYAFYTAVVDNSPNTQEDGVAVIEVYSLDAGQDTDHDGLTDWEESNVYHTLPNDPDSDHDGMRDDWEVAHGLDPLHNDAGGDLDGDGFTNLFEYQHQMDAAHFDLPAGTTVGATQGNLSVDNSGGASYSIPIVVAPGTAGMQPKLSFEYSSRAGNGLLGVGWSIGGLSAITRCSATIAQGDTFIGGVNFSANDRYSLDGQRLIAINGADGADPTEYRTEIDSFSKIVSHALPDSSSPTSFTVQTKSGLTYTYGETDDSRFLAQGRSDALSWALSKISDSSGNYIQFHYFQDQSNGEYRPTSINYTMKGSEEEAYASVQFEYESDDRPDRGFGYVAGSKISQVKRLVRIRTLNGSQLVRQYNLSYVVSPQTFRSRLNQIQEGAGQSCSGPTPCATFNPTTFTWSTEGETDSFILSNFRPANPGNKRTQQWVLGDFNDDGRSDIAKITGTTDGQSGAAQIDVSLALPSAPGSPTDFGTVNWITGGAFNYNTDTWQGGDYNGDGKADIVRVYRNSDDPSADVAVRVDMYRNGGDRFYASPCVITNAPLIPGGHVIYPADVDGDGKLDLVLIYGHSGTKISVLKNMGNNGDTARFEGQTWYTNIQTPVLFGLRLESFIGDVNGDGLPDIIFVKNTGTGNNLCEAWVFVNRLQNGVRSFVAEKWMSPAGSGEPNVQQAVWLSGDFNGDGLLDLGRLRKGSTEIIVYPSTGRALPKQSWGSLSAALTQTAEVRGGDFNGDGRSDIGIVTNVRIGSTDNWNTTQTTYLSLGSNLAGFAMGSTTPIAGTHSEDTITTMGWLPGDFNGDGKEDFARAYGYFAFGQTGIGVHIWTGGSGVHDLLETATDGMGSRSSVSYKVLTDPSVYPRETEPLTGAIGLMVPMSVVSQIRHDDGLGGEYPIDYTYRDLKANPIRGILGFRVVTSTDTRTGIWSNVTLSQEFPFIGKPKLMESRQADNKLLSSVVTTYSDHPANGNRVHFPYARTTTSDSYDLDGTTLTSRVLTTVGENDVDLYGNVTNIVVATGDGFVKTTASTYDNDEEHWRLGKSRDSIVTSQAPGQPTLVRKSGFTYAGNGQIGTETIEPVTSISAQTTYQYDGFGNTHVTTTPGDGVPRTTTTYYDDQGRFATAVVNALGHGETRDYDGRWGALTRVTGPNHLTTRTVYDDFGRKRLEIRPDGSRTIVTYAEAASGDPYLPLRAAFRVSTIPDGMSFATTYFDRLGRELRKVTMSGVDDTGQSRPIIVDTTYNALGQVVSVTRPYFSGETPQTISTHYDLLGRVDRIETPKEGGGVAVTTNHYVGLTVESKNPLQQGTNLKTTTRKDMQGHVVQVTDAKDGTITYTYDAVGNLIQTEDAAHNLTRMAYDTRGRKKSMEDPDLGLWNYDYNAEGELTYQQDANGNITRMEYDKLGRIKKRTEELEGVSEWIYDDAPGKGIGKLHTATYTAYEPGVAPVVRTMSYDSIGRPAQQTERIDAVNYNVATGYDSLSRVSTVTYPSGFAIKYTYDANGYAQKIERDDAAGPVYWKAKRYDADGHITQQQAGNGVVTERVYVPQTGMLSEIHSGLNGSSAVQNLTYSFDEIGNLTGRADLNQTWQSQTNALTIMLQDNFQYDELNRLRFADGPAGQVEVQYNAIGNITFKTGVGSYGYVPGAGSPPASPGEASHPHAVRTAGNLPEAHYDRNGNMTSGFGRTTSWTSFNMPKLITRGNSSSLFAYDSEHARIKQLSQTSGAAITTIYVAGGMYEVVYEAARNVSKHYISSPAGRIALFTQETPHSFPFAPEAGPTTYTTQYLHKDHLDSIDAITNESGVVVERDSFDAWGARRETNWRPPVQPIHSIINRGFTGHEQLDDLGLVHMNGRVYDPGIGRFLSADPFIQATLETQNYNRYSYVLNNPTSLTDPSGFNFLGNFGKWLTNRLGSTGAQIVIGVIAIVAGIATAGAFTAAYAAIMGVTVSSIAPLTGAIVAGAGFGFGSAFTSSALSGASLGESLQAAVIGAVIGGISAGIARELGELNRAGEFFSWGHGGQTLGHALLGGAISEVQGGSFESGALAGAVNGAFGPAIDKIGGGNTDFEHVTERVAVAAVLGGTAAELGGGKFANGAVTAAFLRLYNEEHGLRPSQKADVDAAIKRLANAVSKYSRLFPDYPDGQAVVEALQVAYAEGRIRMGDPSQFLGAYNPFVTDRATGVIYVNPFSKLAGSTTAILLAHEGQHLAQGAPSTRQTRFRVEREAWDVQYGFARAIGSYQSKTTDAYILDTYKPYPWEKHR